MIHAIHARFPVEWIDTWWRSSRDVRGTRFARLYLWRRTMSLVRLLGFRTLTCGCVIGRYRDLASGRELTYLEQRGSTCDSHAHRRNHTVAPEREHVPAVSLIETRAS